MKTIEEVMERHGTVDHKSTPAGELCVRDHTQRLWFYYVWNGEEYRPVRTTGIHPDVKERKFPNREE